MEVGQACFEQGSSVPLIDPSCIADFIGQGALESCRCVLKLLQGRTAGLDLSNTHLGLQQTLWELLGKKCSLERAVHNLLKAALLPARAATNT